MSASLLAGGIVGFVEVCARIVNQSVIDDRAFVLLYAIVFYGVVGVCLGLLFCLFTWCLRSEKKLAGNRFLLYGSPALFTVGVLGILSLHGLLTSLTVSPLPQKETVRGRTKTQGLESAAVQSFPTNPPNILLIVANSLRSDYLAPHGQAQSIAPNIDRLAKDGVRYPNTFTQSPLTGASVTTLFTSLLPTDHGVLHPSDKLPSEVFTLAEILNEAGYVTAGFVAKGELAPPSHFSRGFSTYEFLEPDFPLYASEGASQLSLYPLLKTLQQRFGKLRPNHFYRTAEEVTDKALLWLSKSNTHPFFLYLYYMDTGEPYFRHPYNSESVSRLAKSSVTDKEITELQRLYKGEINYLDQHLGRLFAFLTEHDMMDDCLIVLTSDHGIGFGEHDGEHGVTLYDEQIRVPLIFKLPLNKYAGSVSNQVARTLEIAPTILDAIGVSVPSHFRGFSLLNPPSFDNGTVSAISAINRDGVLLLSLRTASWKLITADVHNESESPEIELYDLISDPGEQFNLAPQRQTIVARLFTQLTEGIQGNPAPTETPAPVNLDEATKERLRATRLYSIVNMRDTYDTPQVCVLYINSRTNKIETRGHSKPSNS